MSLVKIEPFITDNLASFTFGGLSITANAVFGNANLGNLATTNFLSVTSNITASNANLGNATTSNYFIGNGSLLTGITASSLVNGTSNIRLASGGNANISIGGTSNVAVFTTTGVNIAGYLNATNVIGDGGNLSNITGANVTGTVSSATSATTAGTVTTAAQPNITSVGLLTGLSVNGSVSVIGYSNVVGNLNATGNLTAGNANLGNSVVANYFTGSGAFLTSVAAVTAGTVTTNAQPAITSVGTLTSLIVGNATANTTFGNGTITATGNINFTGSNVSLGSIDNLKITGGTSGYFITTDGAGNLSWGAASGGGGGTSASGSNTQIQFNDAGALGASANLAFNKTTKILSVDRTVQINGANLGSNVSNVYIGGGSANQILKTDGSGNLTWVAQPVATITVDNFTGDGTTVAFTLSTTPTSKNFTTVNYNGAFQLREAYNISGTTLTFTEAPASGAKVEVTTTSGATSGAGSFVTRTYTGDGSTSTYTVTSGCTVSSVLVTENGIVQTPTTDYTISGTTLTFTTAPTNSMAIQIRELAIAIVTAPAATSLTAAVANVIITGGSSGQYIKTDGTGTLSFATVTIPDPLSPFLLMGA